FMARPKIKDSSFADPPYTAAAEMFAFVPMLFKHHFVRRRDVKWFVIHLSLRNVPGRGQSLSNGMARQPRCHVAWGAVGPVSRKAAARQFEQPPAVIFVREQWRQWIASFGCDEWFGARGFQALEFGSGKLC